MSSTPSTPSARQAEPGLGAARSAMLNLFDSFYFPSSRRRLRMLPMGKALAAFAAASLLMLWDPNRIAMRYAFAFAVAAFISAALINRIRQPRSLSFSRSLPSRVVEGALFDYVVSVTNQGRRASPAINCRDQGRVRFPTAREWRRSTPPFDAQMHAFDRWLGYPKWLWLVETSHDVLGGDFWIPPLEPGQTVRVAVQGRAGRRGKRLFMGFYCGLCDPLGLRQLIFFAKLPQTLLVLPKPLHSGIGIPIGSRSMSAGDSRDLRKTGDSEEFRSLREWRSGDPVKRIDWKATARASSPVAREYAPEYKLRTALAFDTGLPDGVDEQAFEDAMGYAAGLAVSIDRKDRNIDLLLVEGEAVALQLGQGSQDHILALERLASCSPSHPSSLDELEASILTASANFSSVVLVCPAWSERHAAMAANLAGRGIGLAILVCSVSVHGGFPPGATVKLLAGGAA